MGYDRYNEKNELLLLGNMCNLKVEYAKLSDFFIFLAKKNISTDMNCKLIGTNFYVSLYFSTKQFAEDAYKKLVQWNP